MAVSREEFDAAVSRLEGADARLSEAQDDLQRQIIALERIVGENLHKAVTAASADLRADIREVSETLHGQNSAALKFIGGILTIVAGYASLHYGLHIG